MAANRVIEVAHLHQPGGWLSPGYLEIDATGTIVSGGSALPAGSSGVDERVDGFGIPGMANVHSHAHQRGLVGRAERTAVARPDTFWTWREQMYRFANLLEPDEFEAIAAQAFLEMVSSGFTSVGEFHYLHNAPDGSRYADPAEMSRRVVAAAGSAGIALTLLPALYTRGGIEIPPEPGQRRFILDLETCQQLVEQLSGEAQVGIAPHSLRAVDTDELLNLVAANPGLPVHIHVAEQPREVEECVAGLGSPPARWLLENAGAGEGWTFIHATHCTADELSEMARRGVTVGLCPTTEASLADGLFPLTAFHGESGRWSIGTDANNRLDVAEELRVLAQGQRLRDGRREVLTASEETSHLGRLMFDSAATHGARSIAQPSGGLAAGKRADLVVLDPDSAVLAGHEPETVLDAWVFGGNGRDVRDVMVGGRWVVKDRHHIREEQIVPRFRATMRELQKQM